MHRVHPFIGTPPAGGAPRPRSRRTARAAVGLAAGALVVLLGSAGAPAWAADGGTGTEPTVIDPVFVEPTCANNNTPQVVVTPVDGVTASTVGTVAPGQTVTVTLELTDPLVNGDTGISWSRFYPHTFAAAQNCETQVEAVAIGTAMTLPNTAVPQTSNTAALAETGVTDVGPLAAISLTLLLLGGGLLLAARR